MFSGLITNHKPKTAWVAQGIEGTGKGFVFNQIITPLLGAHNVTSVTTATIEDDFNGWLQGVLYVFVDEVDVDDFKEKGRVSSKLRNLITEPTMSLRHMRQTAVSAPNWASFLFSSNKLQPVHIPETDRRYTVGNHQGYKLPLPDGEAVAAELEIFAAYLLAHEADTKAADTIINTDARERIQKMGVTSIVVTCRAIINGDFDALWMTRPDEQLLASSAISTHTQNASAYVMLMKDIGLRLIALPEKDWKNYPVTRDEIMVILQYNVGGMPPTPNKFTSLLRHNGIETTQLRKNGVRTYGLSVNWTMSDELRAELTMIAAPRKLKAIK